jgi:DnaA-homolog protein
MPVSPQNLLPLESRRSDRFETFVPGPNRAVVAALQQLQAGGGCAFVRGPQGSGKSHLLNALCHRATEEGRSAFYIAPGSLPERASASLAGLESYELVCVDDIDRMAGSSAWEEALFYCFNRLRERSRVLVSSSTVPLATIPFVLPDLRSRLAWGVRLSLEPLDDHAKAEVLDRRARALGIDLPGVVREYLLKRGSRSLSSLLGALEAIRVEALASKRRITVPLAREVLGGEAGPDPRAGL